MKLYNMTFSPTGGTRQVAEQLSSVWDCEKVNVNLLEANKDYGIWELEEDDVCIVAVPSFGGRVPAVALERLSAVRGNRAKAVLAAVYGNRDYDDTLLELKDTMETAGFTCVAAVAAVAEHSIMRQYGAGRPDEADREELVSFGRKIKEQTEQKKTGDSLDVPGNRPYRKYSGVPLRPKADKTCSRCGLCSRECPVHAIPADNPSETSEDVCISCMRCIQVCPNHARKLNKLMVNVAAQKLKKACAEPKRNELFL